MVDGSTRSNKMIGVVEGTILAGLVIVMIQLIHTLEHKIKKG
jgi:hypothetical protein